MIKKRSISQAVLLQSSILLLLMVLCLGYFWVYREYLRFQVEIKAIRTQFIQSQQALIQREVLRVVEYVRYMRSLTEARVKTGLRERVYEAHGVATHLYDLYRDAFPEPELRRIIVESLRPVRFNSERGYYFATSMDGVERLFADRPDFENKNLLAMRDTKGKYVIRDMIALVRKKDEGYYDYTWTKPGRAGQGFPKIAFIKYFKPLDMFIGCGEYVDDMESDLQHETLERISQITFGNNGYVFVLDLDGRFLTHPQQELVGTSFRDLADPYAWKIGEELLKAARYPNGGYVTYQWRKPSLGTGAPKLSYAQLFPDWGWVIVTGVYLDDIEQIVAHRVAEYRNTIQRQLVSIGLLFVSLVALGLLIAGFFSRKIRREIGLFIGFFRRAAMSHEKIDPKALSFAEFGTLGEFANRMSDEIRSQQEELRSEKDRAQMYLDTAGVMFVALDREGAVTLVNKKGCDLLGWTEAEILGRNWFDLFVPSDERQQAGELFRKFMETRKGELEHGENQVLTRDGSLRLIAWHHAVIDDDEGASAGVLMSGEDITERRKTEQRLQRSQRQLQQTQKMEALGALAGGIAHDFNNLLGAIIGYSELCKEWVRDRPKVRGGLEQVLAAASRAKELVQQILTFSRMAEQEKKSIPLIPIVKEVAKFMRASLPATIEVKQAFNVTSDVVWADPTQMHQVLMNLATNAGHAMRKTGGRLEIVLDEVPIDVKEPGHFSLKPGRYLQITVRDTGHGIPREYLERIFEPYFTTKEKGEGTGLGLSMVDGIVKEHGGEIKVYSEPGKGATFHVYLPLIEWQAAEGEREEQGVSQRGTESILVIDDEQTLASMGKLILEDLGYRVVAESDPERAIALFGQDVNAFDLVITDKTMPHLTGFDVARQIRRLRGDIPVIICSGLQEKEDAARQAELGIAHFIMKPINRSVLSGTVRRALAGASRKPVSPPPA